MNPPTPEQVTQALSDKKKAMTHAWNDDLEHLSLGEERKRSYLAGLTESRKENEALRELLERAVKAIEFKNQLLVCYRIGKPPSEKLWDGLEKVKDVLKDYNALMEKK